MFPVEPIKKNIRQPVNFPKAYLIFAFLLFAGIGDVYSQNAPPTGQEIINVADGTFDAAPSVIKSNSVKVVVGSDPEFTLGPNGEITELRGRTVSFTHQLRNTGNIASAFDIVINNRQDDDFDLQNLQLEDESTSTLSAQKQSQAAPVNTVTTSVNLQPGEQFTFTYKGSISRNEERRKLRALLNVEAISREFGATLSNVDTVNVLQGTEFDLQKQQSSDNLQAGDTFSYILQGRNIGDVDAPGRSVTIDGVQQNRVVFTDSIPVNTTFAGFRNVGNGTPLYHVPGNSQFEYTSVAPSDLSSVDIVALAFNSVAAGESFGMTFDVRINDNATGLLENTAEISYTDPEGTVTTTTASNKVIANLPDLDAEIDYFTGDNYGQRTGTSKVGRLLFLEASAARCNINGSVADEATITLTSQITGDQEVFAAIETNVNTGIFRISTQVPTRDANEFNAVSGNSIVETAKKDEIEAVLFCQALNNSSTARASILKDPSGVVFDSETGEPVAGAEVRVVISGTGELAQVFDADGTTELDNIQTTDASGQFLFPFLQPGNYQLQVNPPQNYSFSSEVEINQLPGNRTVDSTGSYGRQFAIQPNPNGVGFDIPLDPQSDGVLFIEKQVDRKEAEIGDFVNYTIDIRSEAINRVENLFVNDDLPLGFEYQLGSARVNGQSISNPQGGKGPGLRFDVGDIESGSSKTLTYRVFIGPGARRGNGTNVALAQSDEVIPKTSNEANVKVDVRGGVFSNDGFIIGKVFLDCNENGVQDTDETGVPGVRLYLQNGNYVITDAYGMYTFYGISPNKHVVKIDNYSLPEGSRLGELDNRHAGDPSSRFVDVKNGEMQRADFAICNCNESIENEISSRKQAYAETEDKSLESSLNSSFTADGNERSTGGRFDQASGTVGESDIKPLEQQLPETRDQDWGEQSQADSSDSNNSEQRQAMEEALVNAEPGLGFLNIADNDTLSSGKTTIWAKGTAGASFNLFINGGEISGQKIGQRSALAEKSMQAWEFVSLDLNPGANDIVLQETDPFGNVRGEKTIVVYAPGELSKIKVKGPREIINADGATPAYITVELLDANGVRVGSKVPVTLDLSEGEWNVKDQDSKEPGTQVSVEGGITRFELAPSIEPKTVTVKAYAGLLEDKADVSYLPDLRPLIAAGIVEGTIRLNDPLNISQAAADDGFERELKALSRDFGNFTADARINFFLKGKVRGDMLLTAGFDSEKKDDDRLFRDIRPDEFYPIYGESSIKGFDAQSTSRLYVRVDKGKTYALYGDFITQENNPDRQLGDYSRAQTGLKAHYEQGIVQTNLFGVSSASSRRVRELRGEGISRYELPDEDIIENSDIIELVTFDRNQPEVILNVERLTRFRDYVIEPFSGVLTFRSPVSSVDQDFNPVFISATYEVENNNDQYFIGGVNSTVDVSENLSVGANLVQDNDPTNNFTLASGNVGVQLGENTDIIGEYAFTNTDLAGSGSAARVEVRHKGEKADFSAQVGSSDRDFSNRTSTLGQGRTEAKARGRYRLATSTNLNGEFLLSRNDTTGAQTLGGVVNLQQTFAKNISAELGLRHSEQTGQNNDVANTNIRSKVTADLPFLQGASAYSEYEQDLREADRRLIEVGGDYKVQNFAKFYARHEFISSAAGRYTLNSNAQQNNTVAGIDANYMKNGQVYSEYRMNEGIDGRSGQAAIGLRNRFIIREGFGINAGFERIFTVEGSPVNDGTSISAAVDYTANPDWKGTARAEARFGNNTDTYFGSLGYGRKLSDDWTFLGKNVVALSKTEGLSGFSKIQQRMRLGAAYRDIRTNRFDALFRYEFKYGKDALVSSNHFRMAHVFSSHANYKPSRDWTFSGRVAAKSSVEQDDLLKSKAFLELLTGRVIYDIDDKWDAGVNASMLANADFSKKDYGFGIEFGYVVAKNLRLATGFNFFGFNDEDLAASNYTQKGVYAGFSYKFDEQIFKSLAPGSGRRVVDDRMYLTCEDGCYTKPVITPFELVMPKFELDPSELKAESIRYENLEILTVLPKHIHFNNNSTFINQPAAKMLDLVSEFLLERDDYFIKVTGHTDSKESYEYNLDLSDRRARAVRAYLVAAGVDADKLQFEGLSFGKQYADEEDRVDMAKNRRVELELSVENANIRFITQFEDLQVNSNIPGIANWDYVFDPRHHAVPSAFNNVNGSLNAVHEYMLERIVMMMTELEQVKLEIASSNQAVVNFITAKLNDAGIVPSRINVIDGPGNQVSFSYTNQQELVIYDQNDDVELAGNDIALSAMNNLLSMLKNRDDAILLRQETENFVVPGNVIFESGSSELSLENRAVMSRVGSYLLTLRGADLEIVSNGSEPGLNKARNIKDYLVEWGISDDRINIVSSDEGTVNELKLNYLVPDAINLETIWDVINYQAGG